MKLFAMFIVLNVVATIAIGKIAMVPAEPIEMDTDYEIEEVMPPMPPPNMMEPLLMEIEENSLEVEVELPSNSTFEFSQMIQTRNNPSCVKDNTLIVEKSLSYFQGNEFDCQRRCQQDANCVFFTYATDTGECGLRYYWPRLWVSSPQKRGGYKNGAIYTDQVLVGDSKSLANTNACLDACRQDNQCKAITFRNPNTCFFTYATTTLVEKQLPPGTGIVSALRDCPGTDKTTPSVCCSRVEVKYNAGYEENGAPSSIPWVYGSYRKDAGMANDKETWTSEFSNGEFGIWWDGGSWNVALASDKPRSVAYAYTRYTTTAKCPDESSLNNNWNFYDYSSYQWKPAYGGFNIQCI